MPRPLHWPSTTILATITLLATSVVVAGPASAAVPSPPTNVTARAGDQLAQVAWSAPTPDDPSITGYTITASPLDAPAVTVDPTARTRHRHRADQRHRLHLHGHRRQPRRHQPAL